MAFLKHGKLGILGAALAALLTSLAAWPGFRERSVYASALEEKAALLLGEGQKEKQELSGEKETEEEVSRALSLAKEALLGAEPVDRGELYETYLEYQEEASDEEGLLPEPASPEDYSLGRLIFIGDSRTVGMQNAVRDDSIWSCKVGMGYNWMTITGVPDIEPFIDDKTSVIILMGVNDPFNLPHYISYINVKASEWAAIGARTYFVSVGPLMQDPYVTNEQIEVFNASMQASLSGVGYIDIYTYLTENGYATVDGIHYTDAVSIGIYNYILANLERVGKSLWG